MNMTDIQRWMLADSTICSQCQLSQNASRNGMLGHIEWFELRSSLQLAIHKVDCYTGGLHSLKWQAVGSSDSTWLTFSRPRDDSVNGTP